MDYKAVRGILKQVWLGTILGQIKSNHPLIDFKGVA